MIALPVTPLRNKLSYGVNPLETGAYTQGLSLLLSEFSAIGVKYWLLAFCLISLQGYSVITQQIFF